MADGSHPILDGENFERAPEAASPYAPVCFVVDEDRSIRNFLSLILHGAGIDTEEFADRTSFARAIAQRHPVIVFLNVGTETGEAIEILQLLAQRSYVGFVQLMSRRGPTAIEQVQNASDPHKLQMLPVLKKPFDNSAVADIIRQLELGDPAPTTAKIKLDDALRNGWIEFWYQPKISLRKKQLAGVESFARARHPQFGVLSPGAFMPGAAKADLIILAELALVSALKAAARCSKVGINLRFAVNMPADALAKLPIADIVRALRPQTDHWAGLVIDVTEEEIITDLALAARMAELLAHDQVELAIDDFGRGYSSLARLKHLPFCELKVDRTFVNDCGVDRINAPLCKTIIDLAHNFGSAAVAIGIEKASDVRALTKMGCDMGQGFLLGQPMPEERFMSLLRQRAVGQGRPAAALAL